MIVQETGRWAAPMPMETIDSPSATMMISPCRSAPFGEVCRRVEPPVRAGHEGADVVPGQRGEPEHEDVHRAHDEVAGREHRRAGQPTRQVVECLGDRDRGNEHAAHGPEHRRPRTPSSARITLNSHA
jgi:hypothetical protein